MIKNIELWEQVMNAATPAYQDMLESGRGFLMAHISEGSEVLDLGCGEGRNMVTILQKTQKVTGVDHDPVAVANALSKFVEYPHVKVLQADAVRLPFNDETFDVVTIIELMENLGNQKTAVLKESRRILKKEGKIILIVYSENAFDERMKMYKKVNAPIQKIEGTTVIFDKGLGANTSEQFSPQQIQELAEQSWFIMESCVNEGIVNMCILKKA